METPVIIPPLRHYVGEARIIGDWLRGRRSEAGLAARYRGDGRAVMVLPGLFTSDRRTRMLRRLLGAAGYTTHGWGLGHNLPVTSDLLPRLDRRMDQIGAGSEAPVTLVGWSLGGLIARAYAQHAPQRVAGVITLGSPFSGNPRSNRAWRAYELFADHKVDSPPLPFERLVKPPVPTAAIWSASDGIIAAEAARGTPEERDIAIEVSCGHFAMTCAPDALEAILSLLAAPPFRT